MKLTSQLDLHTFESQYSTVWRDQERDICKIRIETAPFFKKKNGRVRERGVEKGRETKVIEGSGDQIHKSFFLGGGKVARGRGTKHAWMVVRGIECYRIPLLGTSHLQASVRRGVFLPNFLLTSCIATIEICLRTISSERKSPHLL